MSAVSLLVLHITICFASLNKTWTLQPSLDYFMHSINFVYEKSVVKINRSKANELFPLSEIGALSRKIQDTRTLDDKSISIIEKEGIVDL